ncbi:MAG TPA: hypothetical protein VNI61_07060, partial [Gemmatimonadales bacterium]|nr:hypothetical protein [Gemmatimonadales bacterium]
IRSGLDPVLDMADPETWDRLVSVIRREQYPPRGLLDDPRFLPGPENPGRTPLLLWQQLVNYFQYFDWQWAAGIMRGVPAGLTGRLAVTLLFLALGAGGLAALRRRDRSTFALLVGLWLVTGFGLVVYMNFKPGFSLFWEQYRTIDEHEVRERDYFFTVSFQTWGLFAALGLVEWARRLAGRWRRGGMGVLLLAALPLVLNFRAASRRHGPDATLARDWAYNLLQSVPPYGVLFTYGDNDTYPLWYAQEVEGVRPDVRMVNLSLANTDWHLRFVRDRPPGPYDPERAPPIYPRDPSRPEGPLFDLDDTTIARLGVVRVDEDVALQAAGATIPIRGGTVLRPADQAVVFVLAKWLGKRPVAFGLGSAGSTFLDLQRALVLRGLVTEVFPGRPDTVRGFTPGIQGYLVDVERTEYLVNRVYRWGPLFRVDTLRLEASAQNVVSTLAIPFLELGQAYAVGGDQAKALEYFRKAQHLSPSPAVAAVIRQIETLGLDRVVEPRRNPPPRP